MLARQVCVQVLCWMPCSSQNCQVWMKWACWKFAVFVILAKFSESISMFSALVIPNLRLINHYLSASSWWFWHKVEKWMRSAQISQTLLISQILLLTHENFIVSADQWQLADWSMIAILSAGGSWAWLRNGYTRFWCYGTGHRGIRWVIVCWTLLAPSQLHNEEDSENMYYRVTNSLGD